MPLFRCSKCGCIENTACSQFWSRDGKGPFCSECDPDIGKWHGEFPKASAKGMFEDEDGFLYSKDEIAKGGYFYGRVNIKRKIEE